ncbi:hypothetical protein BP6252_05272 [Coleophoma cylindrospora]|uniref:Uncharacterized protein n=1 Tax=Coleophoma cylindrospora TaxID=1849047 RepID=A0A3D8RT54_9HELO|nr:hypothetical protein BP6252_05272 [Coleophoma cylindrospora]
MSMSTSLVLDLSLTPLQRKARAHSGSGTIKVIRCADAAVSEIDPRRRGADDPSTSKSTPAHPADTQLPRSEAVREPDLRTLCADVKARASRVLANTAADNWGEKAKRRKTTGSGRMRYLKGVSRKFKNGFQAGAPTGARGPTKAE